MGIVNVTPDSFSGDGLSADAAIARGRQMLASGADAIDVGGESTRPGYTPVEAAEEMRRVLPVVRALASEGALVSIDTSKLAVAEAAVASGARIVNDVWGLTREPALAALAARHHLRLVVMHNQIGHSYPGDVVDAVREGLERSLQVALDAGLERSDVIVDPGIGFGKTAAQNVWVLRRLEDLQALGCEILVGVSRKSFLHRLFGQEMPERVWGTAAAVSASVLAGASWVRVHDVAQMRGVVDVAQAMRPVTPVVAHLALGSNLGDRAGRLEQARALLQAEGARLLRTSAVIETEPWGMVDQPRFLNQVLEVSWPGSARELLHAAKSVESQIGRTASIRWGPREIDVDILLFSEQRIEEPDLVVPHPQILERAFWLEPLAELGISPGSW